MSEGKKEDKKQINSKLIEVSKTQFEYEGKEVCYTINGAISQNPTSLDFQFQLVIKDDGSVHDRRFNLLDTDELRTRLYNFSDETDTNFIQLQGDLQKIKELLIQKRKEQNGEVEPISKGFNVKLDKQAKKVLKSKNLFIQLDKLLGEAGVIGEEKTRLLLFILGSSYRTEYNLHAVIQSTDLEVSAHMINKVSESITELDSYKLDNTTARTFRHFINGELNNKLLVVEDYANITSSKAIQDYQKVQGKNGILSHSPSKNKEGELETRMKQTETHCSSIGASTDSAKFFSEQPRTVLIGLDNSVEQLRRFTEYHCLKMAGMVDEESQQDTRELLRYIVKNVHPKKVVNPFAQSLMLPTSIPNSRMLTVQLLNFSALITLFMQHQREIDDKGRVIATTEDIQIAIELFLDTVLLNIDELNATTRDFFNGIKEMALNLPKGKNSELTQIAIKSELRISKSNINRHLQMLSRLDFVSQQGDKNKGYKYQILNWEENNELKEIILAKLGDPN